MLSQKNLIRILLNSALGGLFIFFWLKVVNINEIIEELGKINYLAIFPFVLFFILSGVLRSLRLKILLSDFKVPFKNILPLTYLSQLLSFTIPLRVGEVTKAVYLSTEYKLDFAKSLIWILLDRFLDFWLVLVLTFLLFLFVPTNLPQNFQQGLNISILAVSIAGSLALFLPNITKRLITIFTHILILNVLKKYFQKITEFLLDTTSLLKRGFIPTLSIILLTFAALISDGLTWYVLFQALSEVNFIKVFLGSLLASLTYLIPAAPGYVGSAEASGLAVFAYGLGFDKTASSVITVLFHALSLICILIAGLTSLFILKFNLNLVWKKFKRE